MSVLWVVLITLLGWTVVAVSMSVLVGQAIARRDREG
jgi:hypothetical protein